MSLPSFAPNFFLQNQTLLTNQATWSQVFNLAQSGTQNDQQQAFAAMHEGFTLLQQALGHDPTARDNLAQLTNSLNDSWEDPQTRAALISKILDGVSSFSAENIQEKLALLVNASGEVAKPNLFGASQDVMEKARKVMGGESLDMSAITRGDIQRAERGDLFAFGLVAERAELGDPVAIEVRDRFIEEGVVEKFLKLEFDRLRAQVGNNNSRDDHVVGLLFCFWNVYHSASAKKIIDQFHLTKPKKFEVTTLTPSAHLASLRAIQEIVSAATKEKPSAEISLPSVAKEVPSKQKASVNGNIDTLIRNEIGMAERGQFAAFKTLAERTEPLAKDAVDDFIQKETLEKFLELEFPRISSLARIGDATALEQLFCFAHFYKSKTAAEIIKKYKLKDPGQPALPAQRALPAPTTKKPAQSEIAKPEAQTPDAVEAIAGDEIAIPLSYHAAVDALLWAAVESGLDGTQLLEKPPEFLIDFIAEHSALHPLEEGIPLLVQVIEAVADAGPGQAGRPVFPLATRESAVDVLALLEVTEVTMPAADQALRRIAENNKLEPAIRKKAQGLLRNTIFDSKEWLGNQEKEPLDKSTQKTPSTLLTAPFQQLLLRNTADRIFRTEGGVDKTIMDAVESLLGLLTSQAISFEKISGLRQVSTLRDLFFFIETHQAEAGIPLLVEVIKVGNELLSSKQPYSEEVKQKALHQIEGALRAVTMLARSSFVAKDSLEHLGELFDLDPAVEARVNSLLSFLAQTISAAGSENPQSEADLIRALLSDPKPWKTLLEFFDPEAVSSNTQEYSAAGKTVEAAAPTKPRSPEELKQRAEEVVLSILNRVGGMDFPEADQSEWVAFLREAFATEDPKINVCFPSIMERGFDGVVIDLIGLNIESLGAKALPLLLKSYSVAKDNSSVHSSYLRILIFNMRNEGIFSLQALRQFYQSDTNPESIAARLELIKTILDETEPETPINNWRVRAESHPDFQEALKNLDEKVVARFGTLAEQGLMSAFSVLVLLEACSNPAAQKLVRELLAAAPQQTATPPVADREALENEYLAALGALRIPFYQSMLQEREAQREMPTPEVESERNESRLSEKSELVGKSELIDEISKRLWEQEGNDSVELESEIGRFLDRVIQANIPRQQIKIPPMIFVEMYRLQTHADLVRFITKHQLEAGISLLAAIISFSKSDRDQNSAKLGLDALSKKYPTAMEVGTAALADRAANESRKREEIISGVVARLSNPESEFPQECIPELQAFLREILSGERRLFENLDSTLSEINNLKGLLRFIHLGMDPRTLPLLLELYPILKVTKDRNFREVHSIIRGRRTFGMIDLEDLQNFYSKKKLSPTEAEKSLEQLRDLIQATDPITEVEEPLSVMEREAKLIFGIPERILHIEQEAYQDIQDEIALFLEQMKKKDLSPEQRAFLSFVGTNADLIHWIQQYPFAEGIPYLARFVEHAQSLGELFGRERNSDEQDWRYTPDYKLRDFVVALEILASFRNSSPTANDALNQIAATEAVPALRSFANDRKLILEDQKRAAAALAILERGALSTRTEAVAPNSINESEVTGDIPEGFPIEGDRWKVPSEVEVLRSLSREGLIFEIIEEILGNENHSSMVENKIRQFLENVIPLDAPPPFVEDLYPVRTHADLIQLIEKHQLEDGIPLLQELIKPEFPPFVQRRSAATDPKLCAALALKALQSLAQKYPAAVEALKEVGEPVALALADKEAGVVQPESVLLAKREAANESRRETGRDTQDWKYYARKFGVDLGEDARQEAGRNNQGWKDYARKFGVDLGEDAPKKISDESVQNVAPNSPQPIPEPALKGGAEVGGVRRPENTEAKQDGSTGVTELVGGYRDEHDFNAGKIALRDEPPSLRERVIDALTAATSDVWKAVGPDGKETWVLDFETSADSSQRYADGTGNTAFHRQGQVSKGLIFAEAFPAIISGVEEAIRQAGIPSVIHAKEEITDLKPIPFGEPLRVRVTAHQKVKSKNNGRPQIITVSREIIRLEKETGNDAWKEAEVLSKAETKLIVGAATNGDKTKEAKVKKVDVSTLPQPTLIVDVTTQTIEEFSQASGDYNPVHVSDSDAKELGLEGRILHGMATYNYAEMALFGRIQAEGSDRPHTVEVAFSGMVRPGDTLSFHVTKDAKGKKVTVLNQRSELILTMEHKFLEGMPSEAISAKQAEALSPTTVQPSLMDQLRSHAMQRLEGEEESSVRPILIDQSQFDGAKRVETLFSDGSREVLSDFGRVETSPTPIESTLNPPPSTLIQPGDRQLVTRTFGETTVEVDAGAGYKSVLRARDSMAAHLPRLKEVLGDRTEQPWFVAGISDGMGLHSTVALLETGVREIIGGYFEPEVLIKAGSEVHRGRLANAVGLEIFAQERGRNLAAIYQDLVLSQWGKETREIPSNIRRTIEKARINSSNKDLNFIDSIAFARWISPSEGVEQLKGVPSLDIEGRVVLMDMKKYQEAKYQGTLDSMGRNHGALLDGLTRYFGPKSTSFFFTWAGGSQNRRVLRGIYGDGALGEAKEIGETDTVSYHLASQNLEMGLDVGNHKIVRFPDFPSFAIFGIPGGGAFAMIARHVLERHGRYADVGDLAPQAFIEAFGGEHNLRNPVAQIELDVAETYHIEEIKANLAEFHQRVAKYREEHPEWDSSKPLSIEASRELLRGLVSEDYVNRIPKATQ